LGSIDHYALLGVPRDASPHLLQSALALRLRLFQMQMPTTPTTSETHRKARDILAGFEAAWKVLSEPRRRAEYDRARSLVANAEPSSRAEHSQEVSGSPFRRPSAALQPMPGRVPTPLTPVPGWAPEAVVAVGVSPSRRPSVGPISAASRRTPRDPSLDLDIPELSLDDEIDAIGATFEISLAAMAVHGPLDPALEDARQALGYLGLRRALSSAQAHESEGHWELASRAWVRAAKCCPDDAWLLANAARTACLAAPKSEEFGRLARRALAIDPENPLARQVLEHAEAKV
jgi:hypothetical protein